MLKIMLTDLIWALGAILILIVAYAAFYWISSTFNIHAREFFCAAGVALGIAAWIVSAKERSRP